MKKAYAIAVAVFIVILPIVAASETCKEPGTKLIILTPDNACDKIREALENYITYLVNGNYELCFSENESSFVPMSTPVSCNAQFELNVSPEATKDIYIVGLNIKKPNGIFDVDGPGLKITKTPTVNVILKDISLTNFKDGIFVANSELPGIVKIISSTITGANPREGSCITVKAPTILEKVTATNCGEGISVQANSVFINASEIFSNKTGVRVYNDFRAPYITGGKIYGNTGENGSPLRANAIKIDSAGFPKPLFYEKLGEDTWVEIPDSEDFYETNLCSTLYILLPISDREPGTFELFYTAVGEKNCTGTSVKGLNQLCNIVKAEDYNLIKIPPGFLKDPQKVSMKPLGVIEGPPKIMKDPIRERLGEKPKFEWLGRKFDTRSDTLRRELPKYNGHEVLQVDVPYNAKTINNDVEKIVMVIVYTDPDFGTISILRPFVQYSYCPIVIASDPLDIPSAGQGATDAVAVDGSDGSGPAANTGGITGPGAGKSGCGTSLTGDYFRNISLALDLWWLLFTLTLLAGLRTVAVRISRRRK